MIWIKTQTGEITSIYGAYIRNSTEIIGFSDNMKMEEIYIGEYRPLFARAIMDDFASHIDKFPGGCFNFPENEAGVKVSTTLVLPAGSVLKNVTELQVRVALRTEMHEIRAFVDGESTVSDWQRNEWRDYFIIGQYDTRQEAAEIVGNWFSAISDNPRATFVIKG